MRHRENDHHLHSWSVRLRIKPEYKILPWPGHCVMFIMLPASRRLDQIEFEKEACLDQKIMSSYILIVLGYPCFNSCFNHLKNVNFK